MFKIGNIIEGKDNFDVMYDDKKDKYYLKHKNKKTLVKDDIDILCFELMKECNESIIKTKKSKKKLATLLIIAALSLGIVSITKLYQDNKISIDYLIDEDASLNDLLINSLKNNQTIRIDQINALSIYLNELSKYQIDKINALKIASRITEYDFQTFELDENNIITFIDSILNIDDYGFVAHELYNYINGYDETYSLNCLANIFANNQESIEKLLNGQDLITVLESDFNNIDTDKDFLPIYIEQYENLLENKVRNYLVKYSIDLIKKNDLENAYLTTEFINGNSKLQSNIFSSEQVLVNKDTNNNYYNEGKDITNQYYLNWYYDLIANYNGDFSNSDQRFLCYLNTSDEINRSLKGTETGHILTRTYGNYYLDIVTCVDMRSYYENNYNYNINLNRFHVLAYFGPVSLSYLQDINTCLKEEVIEGNLDKENYDNFIYKVNEIYTSLYPNLVEDWQNILIENNAIEERISL